MKLFFNSLFYLFCLAQLFSCQTAKKLTSAENYRFYVGTATNLATEGIYICSMNAQTGACKIELKETGIINPSFLTLSKDRQFLYAIHKVENQTNNGVMAYSIHPETGALSQLNQQSSMGRGACYISTDADNKNVLVAHYSSGSIAIMPIEKDGSIGEVSDLVQHEGSSVNKERQEGPHAHYINSGIGNMIYAADLGIDKIMLYQIQNSKFIKAKGISLAMKPGEGPRHIDYHPNGRFLYVMNELAGSVTVFEYIKKGNTYKNLQTISSLPPNFSGFNKSADIHVHPSGKFLYASNRGLVNSITAFSINPKTGLLSYIENESETIDWPRNFAISPNGKFLLCANLNGDSISIFAIDEETGSLSFTGKKLLISKPICIKF